MHAPQERLAVRVGRHGQGPGRSRRVEDHEEHGDESDGTGCGGDEQRGGDPVAVGEDGDGDRGDADPERTWSEVLAEMQTLGSANALLPASPAEAPDSSG